MKSKEQIEHYLLENFGPLLTCDQLAKLLHRKPAGLTWSLSQPNEFADAINGTKVKLGKRTYFKSSPLAAVLSEWTCHE